MHVCFAVSGSVVNSRAEVQFELSIGSTVGAERYSTRSVRPCKAKKSFVLCELPPLVAGNCGSWELLRRTQGAASARRTRREPGSVGRQRGRRRATAGARVVRSPGRAGTGADGWCRVDVVVVVETSAESVSGCLDRPPNTGVTAGSLEETVRPSSASVVR